MFSRMLQPMLSMPRPFQTDVDGAAFSGRAIPVVPAPPELSEMHEADSSLIARLQRAKPRTSEEKRLVHTMVEELLAIQLGATELLAALDGERREELEAELEAIRKRGREQQQVIDRLSAEQQQLEFQFHAARNYAQNCRDQLNDLRTQRVPRWASKQDREALGKKIAKAEDAVRQANEELVAATGAHNQAGDVLAGALEVMGRISNEEIRLRGQLSGKTYADPETGLPIPPQ